MMRSKPPSTVPFRTFDKLDATGDVPCKPPVRDEAVSAVVWRCVQDSSPRQSLSVESIILRRLDKVELSLGRTVNVVELLRTRG